MFYNRLHLCFILLLLSYSGFVISAEKTSIRLGLLPFGTVNWEIKTLLDDKNYISGLFKVQVYYVATPQAAKIALQSGAVDMIVADWVWVSRQRLHAMDLSFFPYSNTSGALMVAKNSPINNLQDLKNSTLGIAGGELDKNWLLLRALFMHKFQTDLASEVQKVFAAPPLLNEQMRVGRLDAIMNYWHYAARLEASGYRKIIDGVQIQKQLGIAEQVPLLGYVFNKQWADANKASVQAFLKATQASKELICTSETSWQNILPLTKSKLAKEQQLLRENFCAGRIKQWGTAQKEAAKEIFKLLKKISNNRLTGSAENIAEGTFWSMP